MSKMFNLNTLDTFFKRHETGKMLNMSKMSMRIYDTERIGVNTNSFPVGRGSMFG